MDRNFPGVPRIKAMLATGTHVLIRVKDGITLRRMGDFLPDGSYLAEISGTGATLTVRVIEYQVSIAGRDAPELFCLITDLLEHAAYPAAVLARAYHWRWIGSETCLKEAKSAISGAGPSTGPILRSQTPALAAQEHAAWVTAVELARAAARAAAEVAVPARRGRRAGQPVHARQISFTAGRRAVIASVQTGAATASLPAPLITANRGRILGRPGQTPHHRRPQPAPRPQDQGPPGLPRRRTLPAHPHRRRRDQRLRHARRLNDPRPPSLRNPQASGTGRPPGAPSGARPLPSLTVINPEGAARHDRHSSITMITLNYMALGLNVTPCMLFFELVARMGSPIGSPVTESHSRTVPSPSAVAMTLPSGLNATANTPSLVLAAWMGAPTRWLMSGFHSRTVPSPPAVARSLPSGLNATPFAEPVQ